MLADPPRARLVAGLLEAPGPRGRRRSGAGQAAPRDSLAPLIFPAGPAHADFAAFDDPHYPKDSKLRVELDDTFLLEVGMGDGKDGLNVTTVPASGHASHVYKVRENGEIHWRRVTFEVDKADLVRLSRVLADNHFLQMAQRYEAKGVSDGAQWVVHVRSGGLDKYVYADNAFPDPLVAVARFVSEQIVDTRPELRAKSKPAPLGPDYGAHLWRGARLYLSSEPEVAALDFENASRIAGLLVPDQPLAEGTQIEVSIVDRSEGDEELTRTAPSGPRFWVFYNGGKVHQDHRYALAVRLVAGSKVLAESEPLPVITLDGAQALEVPLARP